MSHLLNNSRNFQTRSCAYYLFIGLVSGLQWNLIFQLHLECCLRAVSWFGGGCFSVGVIYMFSISSLISPSKSSVWININIEL